MSQLHSYDTNVSFVAQICSYSEWLDCGIYMYTAKKVYEIHLAMNTKLNNKQSLNQHAAV